MKNKRRDRIRNIWHQMKRRCYNSSADSYKYYGARGIQVCDEWLYDLDAFYYWALDNGYDDHLTIDRIDSNRDYEPENCRWSSMKEQDNNRTNSIFLEHNGVTHTIPEWSEILGIEQYVIRNRLNRGWSIDDALNRKVNNYVYKN